MLNQINSFRQAKNLAPVQPEKYTCALADARALEIANNFNHDGFNNPYPTYTLAVENISSNPDYTKVIPAWINSSGHAANLSADTPYGCIGFSNNFYVYEGWRP